MIAALYVEKGGPYSKIEGIQLWDLSKDARNYQGPYPVVAHPPCERWGRYWGGGPSAKVKRVLGDDRGCFKAALTSVRQFGGVLEHPAYSHAWKAFELNRPPTAGGWVPAGDGVGWTCHVEQGHYGHKAKKATWLYGVRCEFLDLTWGPSNATMRIDAGFNSKEHADRVRSSPDYKPLKRLSREERVGTPTPFRDLLIKMALGVYRGKV